MENNTILVDVNNHICTITINRPDKLNALNKEVLDELEHAVDALIQDNAVKSAIITGAGDKAFVAGADITEFLDLDAESGSRLARRGQLLFDKIENSPKIIAAAINGFALGGGCELAMACHFRVASDNTRFSQPEVNLGLLPGFGGTQRLTQLIGKGRALEMLASGSMIDALTAFNYGLVNHVVSQGELLLKTKSILAMINTKAPLAVASCIKAVQQAYDENKKGYLYEANEFGKLLETADCKEGVAAFLEKRTALFKGK